MFVVFFARSVLVLEMFQTPEECLPQEQSCFLSCQELNWKTSVGVHIQIVIYTQMLHVGNIYLHFPLNVAIFHLM